MGRRYSKLKVFRYPDKIASLPRNSGTILPPIHVRIKPTNLCAHRCWYCAYKKEDLQLGRDMVTKHAIPRDKMLEIIDDVVAMDVRAVTFSGGGDPFYYPHLLESVSRLADAGIGFAALTNGAQLRGAIAELFARQGSWVRVSMDGWDEQSYAEYRGVGEKEFSRVMDNLAAFKRLGGHCSLGVSLIVDRKNHAHVYDFISRLKSVGVDSVKVSPCLISDDRGECMRYLEPIFDAVKAQTGRAVTDLRSPAFEIQDGFHQLDNDYAKTYHWCPYLQILPVIGADLNVYACHDKAYNPGGLLGSIRESRFRDFWTEDQERFFAIDPSRDCNHHCCADGNNQMLLEYLSLDEEHIGFV